MGIKQPPNYVHPNKKKESKRSQNRILEKQSSRESPEHRQRPAALKSVKVEKTTLTQTQLVRLVVRPPLPGYVVLYDNMLNGGLSSKRALLGLLKRGFPQFKSDLLTGKDTKENTVMFDDGKVIETTRSIDSIFLEKARAAFDPFGVLTDRALGQKIGEAIVCRAAKEKINE